MAFEPFKIEIDPNDLAEVQFMLATVKNGAETAIMRAANDTAVTARSRIVDTAYARLNLKKAEIRESTNVIKAFPGNLKATAYIMKKHIPLFKYPHLASYVGVSVAMRKSSPSTIFRHKFLATMKSGHTGIFERDYVNGKAVKRLPIEEGFGLKVGEVFHYNDEEAVFADMQDLFSKRLLERADYLLSSSKATF